MGFRKHQREPEQQSPAAAKLSRLSTPDVLLACEQAIMAAGQQVSYLMRGDDYVRYLKQLNEQIVLAQGCLEVLEHRG